MSLKQMGNWKIELPALTKRQSAVRKNLKKFRKKWLRKMPSYLFKHFKDYQY